MSSNATRTIRRASAIGPLGFVLVTLSAPLAAQNDGAVTQESETSQDAQSGGDIGGGAPAEAPAQAEEVDNRAVNILITVPRGDVSEAQAKECEDRADAGAISGEIVVCRRIGEDPSNYFSGSRTAAQKRYAQETAFKGDPRAPNTFGIANHGNAIGFGSVPPPALLIDVESLPPPPPGSDADRIARGLPPLGEEELSADEIRKRREALGLPPPKFEGRPK